MLELERKIRNGSRETFSAALMARAAELADTLTKGQKVNYDDIIKDFKPVSYDQIESSDPEATRFSKLIKFWCSNKEPVNKRDLAAAVRALGYLGSVNRQYAKELAIFKDAVESELEV